PHQVSFRIFPVQERDPDTGQPLLLPTNHHHRIIGGKGRCESGDVLGAVKRMWGHEPESVRDCLVPRGEGFGYGFPPGSRTWTVSWGRVEPRADWPTFLGEKTRLVGNGQKRLDGFVGQITHELAWVAAFLMDLFQPLAVGDKEPGQFAWPLE